MSQGKFTDVWYSFHNSSRLKMFNSCSTVHQSLGGLWGKSILFLLLCISCHHHFRRNLIKSFASEDTFVNFVIHGWGGALWKNWWKKKHNSKIIILANWRPVFTWRTFRKSALRYFLIGLIRIYSLHN